MVDSHRHAEEWHRPVMCEEACGHLVTAPAGVLLDCTLGMGGHTAALIGGGSLGRGCRS